MYFTLELCATPFRTGSCCKRIISSQGTDRVVIDCLDHNPAHVGHALELLRSPDIEVIPGVESADCEALYPRFNELMRQWVAKK